MIPTLSICIPTLNRPELLLQSLNSIFYESLLLDQLEICISNNCSEADYATVEKLLSANANRCNIKYVRHVQRLPLDENHHYVKRMATSEYIYFLGDDDFFLRDELNKLLKLIKENKPDLAIFNGYLIDKNNDFLGMHFSLVPRVYNSIETAFRDLRDKGTFGAVLVRTNLLRDEDFKQLYQTDHAYGCYWLSLFDKTERSESLNISVPDFPCVAIRCASKNYNHIDVYFKTIPCEILKRQQLVKSDFLRQLLDEHAIATEKLTSSFRFLCNLSESGHDLREIRIVNPFFYHRYNCKIWIARKIAASMIYKLFRRLYRSSIKIIKKPMAISFRNEINYKLSLVNTSKNQCI